MQSDALRSAVAKLGGLRAAGRALDIDESVIRYWIKTGHVPRWRVRELKALESVNDECGEERGDRGVCP